MRKIFTQFSVFILGLFFCSYAFSVRAQSAKSSNFKGPVFYINLMLPSGDTLLLVDGTAAMYSKDFSDGVDEYDAGKLPNFNENICLMRNGDKLAVEARKIPIIINDTLFLNMWGMRKQTYSLQIAPNNSCQALAANAWLNDKYLNKKIPLSLNNKTFYNFTANTDSSSFANRFTIVFNRNTFVANPVKTNNPINESSVKVSPNPLNGNTIMLQFFNMVKDNYSVKLSNYSGKVFMNNNIIHPGGNNKYYIQLNNVYTSGIYSITITGKNSGKAILLPLIIN